jgi:transcriptional regulator with XRE-family HTH domain
MEDRLGALIRAVRRRRGMRQEDLARLAGVSHSTVSLVEREHWQKLSLATVRAIAAALDIRVDVMGRWRGGDADRLLNRRHSLLAESVVDGSSNRRFRSRSTASAGSSTCLPGMGRPVSCWRSNSRRSSRTSTN